MPTETISPIVEYEQQESPELEVNAAEFCSAYRAVCDLQRLTVAHLMHLRPHDLSAGAMQKHGDEYRLEHVERILASPKIQAIIDQSIKNGHYPPILHDEAMRSYIFGLSRAGFVGGLIEGITNGELNQNTKRRFYKERLIDMNHTFTQLIDSEFGRNAGFNRQNLHDLLAAAFGAGHDEDSLKLVTSLEAGLAVEVGTKRYMEEIGPEFGIKVRFSTVTEDGKKIDVMCTNSRNNLGIDIKSGDKNSGADGEPRAYYSPIEQLDLHEYRVRELYPAKHTTIDSNFEIKADAYKHKIHELFTEFNALP